MEPLVNLRTIRTFGDSISDAFEFFRIHFKPLGKLLTLFTLPFAVLGAFFLNKTFSGFFLLAQEGAVVGSENILGISYFLGLFFNLLSTFIIYALCNYYIKLVDKNEPVPDAGEIARVLFPKIFGYIGLSFLIGMAFFFGLIIFVIPGIYIFFRFSLAPTIYIIEECSVSQAMSRSWDLVKDNWWITFGVYSVAAIISSIAGSFVALPIGVISGILSAFTVGVENIAATAGLVYAIVIVVSIFFSSYLYIALGLHYFSLNEKAGGDHLLSKIDELSS